jgi:steroid 5-alpha reductase family enzyme
MTTSFTAVGVILLIYVTVGFALSVWWHRNDVADALWGPGILLAAVTALLTSGQAIETSGLAQLICLLIFLWAVRIAWQIGRRFLSKTQEDPRYATWRRSWKYFYIRSYFQVFILQGVLMILVAMSAIAATLYRDVTDSRTAVVSVGCTVFVFGLVFEAVADMQLNTFVKSKTDKAAILTKGLWRYSRHPNYFGEVTTWWGLWIISTAPAVANPTAANLSIMLLALISPVTITILILKVSGIPMLEAKYAGNGKFAAYKQHTSAFFPWFPKPPSPRTVTVGHSPLPDQPASKSK